MDEQKALLKIFNKRYHSGRKNRLIADLILTAGLRVSEVCKLKWSDLRYRDSKSLFKEAIGDKDIRKVQEIAGY